ncbi:MAG: CRISPR-associated protein Cas4 [Nanoarchaeota archaeon]
MKTIINVTDIISYLYCPRKVYLKLVKGIKEPPTKQMISGFLKHKIFDIFNKNESIIVSSIKENLNEEEIQTLYKQQIVKITQEAVSIYSNMLKSFSISQQELLNSILEFMEKEINLRVSAIKSSLNLGFRGKELWRELKPKYLTEFSVISENLGLKGRIDRVRLEEEILPYEIKTRDEIYESDKIQLAAYSLLLQEEFGKKVDKGIVETKTKKQEVELTDEMKDRVLQIAEEIRNMKEAEMPNNFKKCRYCNSREECFE